MYRDAPASQFQFPGFADQVLAETAVRLGGDQLESGFLIDFAGGDRDARGPERDPPIAAGFGERDAFGDQPMAQPLATPGRVDQQQAQLRYVIGVPHQKYGADLRSIDVCDPATFPRCIERAKEFGRDLGDEPFERGIPAVFAGVERAVALNYPSHVAGPRLAQRLQLWRGTAI